MTHRMAQLMVRKLRSLFLIFFRFTLFIFSVFVPEKKNLVVFSMARGRYWDNARALFEYMAENANDSIHVCWLSDPDLNPQVIPEEYLDKFTPRHSVRGWYTCARAKVAIISYSFGDFGLFNEIAKRKKVIMLWHAITVKHIGLLDEKFNNRKKEQYKNKEIRFYDKLTVTSDIDRYYWAASAHLDADKILVTGLPRNDRLFWKRVTLGDALEKKSKEGAILYAPTFRDYSVEHDSIFFPFLRDESQIATWASACGLKFLLRPHPSDNESVIHVRTLCSVYPNVFIDAGVDIFPDVTELIMTCDGIITDYSSIYLDGLILDQPVLFVDHDRESYMEKRGLAYDYDLITPGPKVRTWGNFMQGCEELMRGAPDWAQNREFVRKMFFKHRDANACARITSIIADMVK